MLIDVINDPAFEGSAALVSQAEPLASRLGDPQAARQRRRRAGDLHQRLRTVALGLSQDGGALHVTLLAGSSCVATSETDVARLFRVEAEALGLLRHHARHASGDTFEFGE